jgi:hypothetical protein
MVKIFYSLNKYFLILAISLAAVVIKYFLNFWLVGLFEQDGLALSTTFVYAFLFISGISIIAMKFEVVEIKQFVMRLLYFLICALTAYFVTNTFILFLNINQFYSSVIMLISFVSIYLLNSFVTRINEFALINTTIGNLLRIKK